MKTLLRLLPLCIVLLFAGSTLCGTKLELDHNALIPHSDITKFRTQQELKYFKIKSTGARDSELRNKHTQITLLLSQIGKLKNVLDCVEEQLSDDEKTTLRNGGRLTSEGEAKCWRMLDPKEDKKHILKSIESLRAFKAQCYIELYHISQSLLTELKEFDKTFADSIKSAESEYYENTSNDLPEILKGVWPE